MSLQRELDAFKAAFESGGPPYNVSRERIEIMHRATEELRRSGLAERALKVGDLAQLYAAFGNTLDKFHDEPDFRLPMPARYVVGQDGRIRAADVNPDYTIRPEPEDTVAVVRQLQTAGSKATRSKATS